MQVLRSPNYIYLKEFSNVLKMTIIETNFPLHNYNNMNKTIHTMQEHHNIMQFVQISWH